MEGLKLHNARFETVRRAGLRTRRARRRFAVRLGLGRRADAGLRARGTRRCCVGQGRASRGRGSAGRGAARGEGRRQGAARVLGSAHDGLRGAAWVQGRWDRLGLRPRHRAWAWHARA
jgi:hypothetical protein